MTPLSDETGPSAEAAREIVMAAQLHDTIGPAWCRQIERNIALALDHVRAEATAAERAWCAGIALGMKGSLISPVDLRGTGGWAEAIAAAILATPATRTDEGGGG